MIYIGSVKPQENLWLNRAELVNEAFLMLVCDFAPVFT